MELTSAYLKETRRFGWLNIIYFRVKKVINLTGLWLTGKHKQFLNPSTKTLVGLMQLKERQLYKRKN